MVEALTLRYISPAAGNLRPTTKGAPMTIILAPDGAIFALLAIAAGAPLAPNEEAETWLQEQTLIGYSIDGSVLEVTGRGRAFIGMINSTPLPVRVERWDDPRAVDAPPPPPAAPGFDLAGLATMFAALAKGAAPQAQAAAPAPRTPGAVSATVDLPHGWTPNNFTDLPPGQIPPTLQRDTEIYLMRRDGRKIILHAGAVIFKHTNSRDDVMGWTVNASDSMIVPATVASL